MYYIPAVLKFNRMFLSFSVLHTRVDGVSSTNALYQTQTSIYNKCFLRKSIKRLTQCYSQQLGGLVEVSWLVVTHRCLPEQLWYWSHAHSDHLCAVQPLASIPFQILVLHELLHKSKANV